jgi:hypothetical protein
MKLKHGVFALCVLAAGLPLLGLLASKARQPQPAQPPSGPPGQSAKPVPVAGGANAGADPLARYPLGTRLKLATALGAVSPAFSQRVEIPLTAQVLFRFDGRSASFKKGEVWAEVDPERLKLDAGRLELSRADLDRKSGLLEAKTQALQMQARLREIERTIALMDMPEPAGTDAAAGSAGAEEFKLLRENAEKSKASLLEERELIVKKLAAVQPEAESREAQREGEYKLRKMEHDRLAEASRLIAPCDITVRLLFDPEQGKRLYPVKSGVAFAEITDERRFFAGVPVSGQAWRGVAPAELAVRVRTTGAGAVEARFAESRQAKFLGRDEQMYFFEFANADAAAVRNLAGGAVSVEIMRIVEPSRIIPKLSLLCSHPQEFRGREWREAVARIFPGAGLVAEGEADVAVAEKISGGGSGGGRPSRRDGFDRRMERGRPTSSSNAK